MLEEVLEVIACKSIYYANPFCLYDFFAIVAALYLFDQIFSLLYVFAFSVTISGLIIYHLPFELPWPDWKSICKSENQMTLLENDEEERKLSSGNV